MTRNTGLIPLLTGAGHAAAEVAPPGRDGGAPAAAVGFARLDPEGWGAAAEGGR
jgi:hypothetical protein